MPSNRAARPGSALHVFTALAQIHGGLCQHLLGEWLTHRFLGALEQGFAGAIQHLAAQRAELGEQIRAGRERRIPTRQLIQGNGHFF